MKALVIGGTGPSGPYIVNGLLRRGYDVTILHGGQHEAEFQGPVEHIHTDPHFAETLNPALLNRRFDLTVATYGRIRIIAEVMKGKTERLLTVSGGAYAPDTDRRWGPMGRPAMLVESSSVLADDEHGSRFFHLIWLTEQAVLQAHSEGHYQATILRYPTIYGACAPASMEWSVVRRLLDGRTKIVVGDGGAAVRTRADGENAAHAVLLAVDTPAVAAGQIYNVGEDVVFSERQRIEHIIRVLGANCAIVDMPHELARRASQVLAVRGTRLMDTSRMRAELGYRDVTAPADAIERVARWLVAHPFARGTEGERQLADPFDYAAEDELIRVYEEGTARALRVSFPDIEAGHMYRHPKKPGETWRPVAATRKEDF